MFVIMRKVITEHHKIMFPTCAACNILSLRSCNYSQKLESKYSDSQKDQILQIINDSDITNLSRYNITKLKLKKLTDWVTKNGKIETLSEIESIDGFTEKYASKLCDRILEGPQDTEPSVTVKIKGQVLHPPLSEFIRKNCKTVLAVYVTVNSVCWTLIDRSNYEVLEWIYKPIEYPGIKTVKITDIVNIAWNITKSLPTADVYVMKAEATSLRAAGSDPNNPKALGVNLQKAQMISMIVALINARANSFSSPNEQVDESEKMFKHHVYFLRPTLPFRLHGTLVGNEKVSTDQTVEMILQKTSKNTTDNSQVDVPERLKSMFRSQRELQKDMLGHCLLLAITFMDVCVYINKKSIEKLIKRGE